MANARRRPIAPVRKVVALVLGTFAAFVTLFGIGMGNWIIVAVGVALLVLAISMVAVTVVRSGARAWVTGVAHVHSASEIPASSKFGRCEMQIVIDAPGLPPRSIKVRDPRVPVAKWPRPGTMLPIMVALDDQRHVRILWDDVPTHAEAEAATRGHLDSDYGDDPLAEEILIEQAPPPWAQRDPEEDFLPPAEDILPPPNGTATTADLTEQLAGLDGEPVVVHQTQDGALVLEGTLVDPPPAAVPSPRRSQPGDARPTPAPPPATDDPAPAAARATGGAAAGQEERAAATDLIQEDRDVRSATIHGVGITVLVADLDRSLAFYRDRLGFDEVDGGTDSAVLASGSTRLVLRAVPDITPANRRLVHINLEVEDIHAVYEELKSNGIRFTYPPRLFNIGTRLEQWAAAFRDPDGHGVALTHWRHR
ncbi:MAG TPA: VOC family protein [Micromonosporaceae bacterium]|nr:VOC family protein [Micromonosporaceae bacterium]